METDRTKLNSLNLYGWFAANRKKDSDSDGIKAVKMLAETMTSELVYDKESPLLSASVYALDTPPRRFAAKLHRFEHFNIDLRRNYGDVFPGDATLLIKYLANHISDGQINRNEIYVPWYASFGTGNISFQMSPEWTVYLLKMIDKYLPEFINSPSTAQRIPSEEKKDEKEAQTEQVKKTAETSEAEDKAQEIIRSANEKAEEILKEAEEKAAKRIKEADEIFDARIREAQKRLDEFKSPQVQNLYQNEHADFSSSFTEIRRLLNEAGMSLNQLDQKINTATVRKIFTQYFDLYNLINDAAGHIGDADLTAANVTKNHMVYMDVIMENLEEFGIEYFSSSPGDPYDGKKHEVKNDETFDPRTARIGRSLRHGFIYGNTVLSKELVELEGGQ